MRLAALGRSAPISPAGLGQLDLFVKSRAGVPIIAGMTRPRGDEAELYERHHERLRREVAAYTRASEPLADEACSFAWARLRGIS